jgi:hypothetical protein
MWSARPALLSRTEVSALVDITSRKKPRQTIADSSQADQERSQSHGTHGPRLLINSGVAGWQTITQRDLTLEVNSAIRVLGVGLGSEIRIIAADNDARAGAACGQIDDASRLSPTGTGWSADAGKHYRELAHWLRGVAAKCRLP